MSEFNYFASLKNKEFLILQKLCNNSIPPSEKEELENKLKEIRFEIKKLG